MAASKRAWFPARLVVMPVGVAVMLMRAPAMPVEAPDVATGLGEESCGVLLRAVALVVNRGAFRRPEGLLQRRLHALFMSRQGCITVSNRAARRHCPLWRLPAGALLRVSTISWVPRSNCEL